MMSINIVDKKTAKQIIDNAPVDKITIICLDRKTLIHEKPERREKKYGKELVEIAKSISYDENDIFGILSLDGELKSNELKQLGYCPNIYINQHCMITTPYDMMANQIIEENRGKNKHGSCGLGIYETIKRYKAGVTTLYVSDYIRDYYLKIFDREGIVLTKKWEDLFNDSGIYDHYLEDWDFMNEVATTISDECFLNEYENIVFEAAQGLLLDQNNLKYYPHLTPSNTGIKNPKKIIENVKWDDDINIETCYVSRTYLTRHGAGNFPTECRKNRINKSMYDKTNVPNPFQDTLRYGTLDLKNLYVRCVTDVMNFGDKKSIAITHCNEYKIDVEELEDIFERWNIYYSDGETHDDIYGINN